MKKNNLFKPCYLRKEKEKGKKRSVDEQQSDRQWRKMTTETISRPLILIYLNIIPHEETIL